MTTVERPAQSPPPQAPKRTRRRGPRNRVAIALLGIVAIVIIVYAVFVKRVPFVHGYQINAVFQDANQLKQGFSPVRIAGVNVGKVVGIKDGPGPTSIVTMQLDKDALPVHADARAKIRPRLFLEGSFYVDLQAGSPSAPSLESGDTIPIRQTAVPVQLSQILSSFTRDTRQDFKAFIAGLDTSLADGGAQALQKTWKPFAPLLRDTSEVFGALRGVRPHDASDVIRNTGRVTAALASREQELRGLVTSLARTTRQLASHDTQLAGSIRQFDLLLTDVPSTLNAIQRTVPSVRRFASALEPSLKAAPPVLTHLSGTLQQLGGFVSPRELGGAVDALRPAIQRLPTIESQLNVLFPKVTPVADCVRDRVVATVDQTAPDGALSTNVPIYLDLAHALVGLASAGQNFDANGFAVRYSAGGGSTAVTTEVPGIGSLGGLASEPVAGARPQYLGPGVTPAFRPDVPCMQNAVPDLSQRTGATAAPAARRVTTPAPQVTATQLKARISAATRELKTVAP